MPDTTHFHEDRSTGILEAARRAFAEKGFDGASMQDIARAAGMSAGNFYRYFPSKDAIVAEMIARDLAGVKADFARLLAAPDPALALFHAFESRLEQQHCPDGPLWAEIEAAARRKPHIAEMVASMEAEVCDCLVLAMGHITGRSPSEARTLYSGQAGFLVLMFKAASQHGHANAPAACGEIGKQVRKLVLATIKHTISDLSATAPNRKDELI